MIAPKPLGLLPTKKARVPSRESRRMTIAAGFVCKDGIVLCADSQESAGDYKWPVKKLVVNLHSGLPMIVAGAGFGPAIDTATQKIIERVRGSQDQGLILKGIEETLREIHEKDLAFYPVEDSAILQFSLLIAFKPPRAPGGLFSTNGSLMRRVDTFEVIGSGIVTNFFAHTLYAKRMSLFEGTLLSAYLAHLAKSQLSSIGGRTVKGGVKPGHCGGVKVGHS